MTQDYNSMKLVELRELARERKIHSFSSMKKADLIEAIMQLDAQKAPLDHSQGKDHDIPEKSAPKKEHAVPEKKVGNKQTNTAKKEILLPFRTRSEKMMRRKIRLLHMVIVRTVWGPKRLL